jgi:hypothetical protein
MGIPMPCNTLLVILPTELAVKGRWGGVRALTKENQASTNGKSFQHTSKVSVQDLSLLGAWQ